MDAKKDGYKNAVIESSGNTCLSDRLRVDKSLISLFCVQELYLRQICSLNKKIPKQIKNLEERFIGYCLELIHSSESRKDLQTFLPQSFGCDASSLISIGDESGVISSYSDPIIGSITMNTNMTNALNKPLITQLEVKEPTSSPGVSQVGSSQDRQNRRTVREGQEFVLRDASCSSSNAYDQGSLHCSWNGGFPSYVFAIEGNRRVFITTNVLKDSISDTGIDCIYIFRSGVEDSDVHVLGEMRVSTSFELCPHGTEFMETRFVLYANGDGIEGDECNSDQKVEKNKGLLSKKMANVFRRRSFMRSFGMQESVLEPNQDGDRLPPPKLELAAIVMKDHIRGSRKEGDLGGWGLKFLRKDGNCESCSLCSTGMNVLIPDGFHGGPRSRIGGGPSSLIERWSSGGSCDCGGWDLGCPLTILHDRPNCEDVVLGNGFPFDLFVQGCKQSKPVLKMADVRGGSSFEDIIPLKFCTSR
ncbi:Protein of unknown function DUF3527 [Cynara cardunculus var. scolymus]|uniref:Uncharacterized protein n=1 Tax=Cynara cardunculus var. scolymus TaxID=59895 RepID=A0A103Y0T0_CYNCS|nr:Protein of unknown function DUF3527 [Cynara cardunculus var. scolymus]